MVQQTSGSLRFDHLPEPWTAGAVMLVTQPIINLSNIQGHQVWSPRTYVELQEIKSCQIVVQH
jgi:hypothetical protein